MKPSWNTIFFSAIVLAVSLDPFFFYIPIINEKNKCLDMDVKLKNVALVLRSLFDVTFIMQTVALLLRSLTDIIFIYEICDGVKTQREKKSSGANLASNFYAAESLNKIPI